MRRNALVFALAGVAVAVTAWTLVPARTDAPTPAPATAPAVATHSSNPAPTASQPVGAVGYVARLDGSGHVITGPEAAAPDADFNAEMAKSINTSSEGLKQVPMPGGGYKVDLQGRFMSAYVATKDAKGKLVVPCLTNENDVRAFEAKSAADKAARKE
jgi:hypothetical protein